MKTKLSDHSDRLMRTLDGPCLRAPVTLFMAWEDLP
jgi:hypothetical protein